MDAGELERAPSFYRGRVALYAILRSLGVGAGDEVIVQAFTCLAVVEGVRACGAIPRFADIEADGYTLDPARLAERISPRTRALVVQHTFGLPASMSRIMEIARRHGVPVIEDCCHTYGTRVGGQCVGTFGVASFYSFEWGKPLILGLGGAAVLRDAGLEERVASAYARDFSPPPLMRQLKLEAQYQAFRLLYRPSLYWLVRGAFRTLSRAGIVEGSYHAMTGDPAADFGWTMAPILKRRLRSQLRELPAIEHNAREIVRAYRARIRAPSVQHPIVNEAADVLVRYPVRVPMKEAVLEAARRARVELAGWYATPVHPVPFESLHEVGLDPAECPEAVKRCAEIVSLPVNARVTEGSIERAAALFAAI